MAGTLGRELFPIWDNNLRPQRGTIPKAVALYIHRGGTEYECKDCHLYMPVTEQCSLHRPNDHIRPFGSCGLFFKGTPDQTPDHPFMMLTPTETGYTESPDGFSCKRCEYFVPGESNCMKIDRNSPGDDPGIIHPDACCNAWEDDDD